MKAENYIVRFLSGELSDSEVADFEYLMDNDHELREQFDKMKKIWNEKYDIQSNWDADVACKRLEADMNLIDQRRQVSRKTQPGSSVKKGISLLMISNTAKSMYSLWAFRVIAILVIIGLAGLFAIIYMSDITAEEVVVQEIVTEKGQRSNVHLSDGSRIIVNSESKVSYVRGFNENSRVIQLKGEAFFDVGQENRPFYVYTDEVVIQVMGTEFNVRSYQEEDIEIVVSEGKVTVKYIDAHDDEDVIMLEKGDMVKLSRGRMVDPIVLRDVPLKKYLGWIDYRFQFEDTPMKDVIKSLERSFGVEIELSDPMLLDKVISVSFEGESIHEVLQVIRLVFNLEYEVDGKKILLLRSLS
jgi:transmembrane sensor